jgi:hypothetical protein
MDPLNKAVSRKNGLAFLKAAPNLWPMTLRVLLIFEEM